MPKVSVIIPAYNRANLLPRALETVFQQTFKDYEVIVVDDGSQDETPDDMKQFAGRVKYIRKENGGSASARNRGIEESRGEYIAFLDSDDTWVPEKLVEQVNVLDAHPNVGIVYARMPIINAQGERVGTKPAGVSGKNFQELLKVWGDLPTSTVMTRRECFDKAGMFDPALTTMQDIDMWLRIARHYDLHEIENKTLAYYYRHEDQITSSKIKVYGGLVKIYQKIFKTFADAPRDLMVRRIASNQYMLSRSYYDEGLYWPALKNLVETLYTYPHVGVLLFTESDGMFIKMFKMVKPYAYLAVCSVRALLNSPREMMRKEDK